MQVKQQVVEYLSHIYADDSERPIAFTSRTCTSAERNYSNNERESHLLLFMELRNSMTICMDVLLLFAQITSLWRSC